MGVVAVVGAGDVAAVAIDGDVEGVDVAGIVDVNYDVDVLLLIVFVVAGVRRCCLCWCC